MKPIKGRAVLLFFVSFYLFVLLPLTPVWAQALELPDDIDLFAPLIRHETPSQTLHSESSLKLEAKVTDNIGLNEVSLFYRTSGEEAFSSMKMKSIGEGNYAVTVPKEHLSSPGFEYYIQASDQSGNTSMRGFSFSPLSLVVSSVTEKEKVGVFTRIWCKIIAPRPCAWHEEREESIDEEKTPIIKEEVPALVGELPSSTSEKEEIGVFAKIWCKIIAPRPCAWHEEMEEPIK